MFWTIYVAAGRRRWVVVRGGAWWWAVVVWWFHSNLSLKLCIQTSPSNFAFKICALHVFELRAAAFASSENIYLRVASCYRALQVCVRVIVVSARRVSFVFSSPPGANSCKFVHPHCDEGAPLSSPQRCTAGQKPSCSGTLTLPFATEHKPAVIWRSPLADHHGTRGIGLCYGAVQACAPPLGGAWTIALSEAPRRWVKKQSLTTLHTLAGFHATPKNTHTHTYISYTNTLPERSICCHEHTQRVQRRQTHIRSHLQATARATEHLQYRGASPPSDRRIDGRTPEAQLRQSTACGWSFGCCCCCGCSTCCCCRAQSAGAACGICKHRLEERKTREKVRTSCR